MNDDYLWDGTGEPDPEIQQLEQVLTPLAYQPRPLEIPATVYRQGKHSWVPPLAIAATIALMVFAVGLWMVRQNRMAAESIAVQTPTTISNPSTPATSSAEVKTEEQITGVNSSLTLANTTTREPSRHQPRHRSAGTTPSTLARRSTRNRDLNAKSSELSAEELAEVKQAKAQLFLALRLASSKLNLAQKKAQALPTNLIRNQHKVG